MLSELYNGHTRRACELVWAYEEAEITVGEFETLIGWLPPEIVHIVSAAIGTWVAVSEAHPRLSKARSVLSHVRRVHARN
jgi:hypothetical protein